jgi:uncharacterized protein (DUF488 family)
MNGLSSAAFQLWGFSSGRMAGGFFRTMTNINFMARQKIIYTSGYQGITVNALVARLQAARVEVLVDVRAVPLSRKAGFSKNMLAAHMAEAGIYYVGLRGLGTPPEGRAAALRRDKPALHRIFTAHLKTENARRDLAEAIRIAEAARSCLLCFEHDPACCHRLMVAERMVKKTGQDIVHLPPDGEPLLF